MKLIPKTESLHLSPQTVQRAVWIFNHIILMINVYIRVCMQLYIYMCNYLKQLLYLNTDPP